MSLLALSLPLFLLGLPVLAGLLFLLHRLRIRHRRLEVVTTLFWQEAVEEARARVFVQRFRHPLVYAFLLLISLLLWTGFSDPHLASHPGEQSVILIEGSRTRMGPKGRADALVAVQDLLQQIPTEGRSVIWCGSRQRTLLASGEHAALLEARWAEVEPEACPSHLAEIVGRLAETHAGILPTGRLPLRVVVVGAPDLPGQLIEHLPSDMSVESLAPDVGDPPTDGPRLATLGLAPARSGAWDRWDVLLRLEGQTRPAGAALRVFLGGQPVASKPSHRRESQRQGDEGTDRYLFRDLPARGEQLQVFVEGQDEALGTLILPEKRALRVQVESGLPGELLAVLQSDPGLTLVSSNADVLISTSRGSSSDGEGIPRLWLHRQSRTPRIRFTRETGKGDETRLRDRFDSLGLDRIDPILPPGRAEGAATSSAGSVRMEFVQGRRPMVELPLSLLGDGYNFVQSRAFPLFVAEALRWLAQVDDVPRRTAAGEIVIGEHRALQDEAGSKLDPVGASFFPPAAGLYRDGGQVVLAASLQGSLDDSDVVTLPGLDKVSAAGPGLLFWISILAFLALVAEWILVRTGRIP